MQKQNHNTKINNMQKKSQNTTVKSPLTHQVTAHTNNKNTAAASTKSQHMRNYKRRIQNKVTTHVKTKSQHLQKTKSQQNATKKRHCTEKLKTHA